MMFSVKNVDRNTTHMVILDGRAMFPKNYDIVQSTGTTVNEVTHNITTIPDGNPFLVEIAELRARLNERTASCENLKRRLEEYSRTSNQYYRDGQREGFKQAQELLAKGEVR